jgi:hypothetical protein
VLRKPFNAARLLDLVRERVREHGAAAAH